MRSRSWIACLALGACGGTPPAPLPPENACSDPPRGPLMARFADATRGSGLAFDYISPDYRAGALAVADLDGDGQPDVIATQRSGGLAVFENLGMFHFKHLTNTGLDPDMPASAIAAVDLDNDGDRDVVLAGPDVALVMANQGDGTFVQAARFDGSGTTEQVLAADLDGDGLLDLYFANREIHSTRLSQNQLYLNRGGLHFQVASTIGTGLSWTATAFDFDGDGDQDIYVANDALIPDFGRGGETSTLPPDLFLRNDGPGPDGVPQFTDIAAALGLATPRSSMGGVLADFDDDGRLDLFVPNLGAKKLFLRASADYVERAETMGVTAITRINDTCGPDTTQEDCLLNSWGAAVADFDLDGSDELVVVNGQTAGGLPPVVMFTRGSDVEYHEVSSELGCLDARGIVATDLDGDGDQDVLISQAFGPLMMFENVGTPAPGSWLTVHLTGTASNREGVGALVTVHTASGRTHLRVVGPGGVINSTSPAEAVFGLGTDEVTSIDVAWPSGRHSELIGAQRGTVSITEP